MEPVSTWGSIAGVNADVMVLNCAVRELALVFLAGTCGPALTQAACHCRNSGVQWPAVAAVSCVSPGLSVGARPAVTDAAPACRDKDELQAALPEHAEAHRARRLDGMSASHDGLVHGACALCCGALHRLHALTLAPLPPDCHGCRPQVSCASPQPHAAMQQQPDHGVCSMLHAV